MQVSSWSRTPDQPWRHVAQLHALPNGDSVLAAASVTGFEHGLRMADLIESHLVRSVSRPPATAQLFEDLNRALTRRCPQGNHVALLLAVRRREAEYLEVLNGGWSRPMTLASDDGVRSLTEHAPPAGILEIDASMVPDPIVLPIARRRMLVIHDGILDHREPVSASGERAWYTEERLRSVIAGAADASWDPAHVADAIRGDFDAFLCGDWTCAESTVTVAVA